MLAPAFNSWLIVPSCVKTPSFYGLGFVGLFEVRYEDFAKNESPCVGKNGSHPPFVEGNVSGVFFSSYTLSIAVYSLKF